MDMSAGSKHKGDLVESSVISHLRDFIFRISKFPLASLLDEFPLSLRPDDATGKTRKPSGPVVMNRKEHSLLSGIVSKIEFGNRKTMYVSSTEVVTRFGEVECATILSEVFPFVGEGDLSPIFLFCRGTRIAPFSEIDIVFRFQKLVAFDLVTDLDKLRFFP